MAELCVGLPYIATNEWQFRNFAVWSSSGQTFSEGVRFRARIIICPSNVGSRPFLIGDLLHLDGSDLFSNLIGKKLVFMIDPFAIESEPGSAIYNVFRGSANPFLFKLFEDAQQVISSSTVASYELMQGVLDENKFVSQYDCLPWVEKIPSKLFFENFTISIKHA
ncbi:hypothetical protein PIB30_052937 [Stylosanthes scabra]|uniref:Uncharacterized protein n=1 Tax=Stylosanthes scabra TaxID=79078 RepID=A0ABU6XG48_9FABA|nr:hypothetical protein [Stylosanthes scabra]